jgi:hypothetical protein
VKIQKKLEERVLWEDGRLKWGFVVFRRLGRLLEVEETLRRFPIRSLRYNTVNCGSF